VDFQASLPAPASDGLLNRPKQGFEIPVDAWLRGALVPMFRETVLDCHSAVAELIDQRRAAELLDEHQQGRGRHGQVLWSLLVLSRWTERFLSPRPAWA
jgi:asparagine synthase (glutamine-hydrolysing)